MPISLLRNSNKMRLWGSRAATLGRLQAAPIYCNILPHTDFAMKANLAQKEPELLKFWNEINLYQKLRKIADGRPKFILHDGPPYANGEIHLGTALNKILKDIVVKSKALSGFDAPFVPGWDCHGLPIELKVEKKVGKAGVKISPTEFRKACRDFANSQIEIQKRDFQRLGVIGDWEHPYLTMNFTYEANIIRTLAKIVANGHLLRGEKPVHWCIDCASALAEAEVEYKDKSSPAIDVAFEVLEPQKIFAEFQVKDRAEKVIVPIWTTTPWTLPANQAVAVHPEIDYVLVNVELNNQSVNLILAENLLSSVMSRYEIEKFEVLAQKKGKVLEGILLQHPFLERKVPLVFGEHITTDTGTGNVHIAPAHGQDDYLIGRKYQLAIENPVNARGCFDENTKIVGGMHVSKANEPIIVHLADNGHLLHHQNFQHSYPHCWRHKTPIIFRATPQWFISMEKEDLRAKSLSAIRNVRWFPQWGESRITKMIENRPDWCISRQRTWGVPLALFIHKDTNALHPNYLELMEKVAQLVEKKGIDAWFDLDAKELLGDEADNYLKTSDILDVWFDSGVSHACVLDVYSELKTPADLYLEGSDQHRGWFQTSLLTSMAYRDNPPFKSVLTHGYVVDGKGYKMSKSIGNTIAPSDVIKKLGADMLRLWVASTDHTNEIAYSDEIMARCSDAYRRIRNTVRFLLSNLYDFDAQKDLLQEDKLLALDRWAIAKTSELQHKIIEAYNEYQFPTIYQLIHNFCSVELGGFYLDIIKDRQYTSFKNGLPRRSAQTVMYHILQAMVRWLAPILSFTAEEIWRYIPGKDAESVFLSTWYEGLPTIERLDMDYWAWLIQVRSEVNRALEERRNKGEIGSALDAEINLYADQESYNKLNYLDAELKFLLITSKVNVLSAEHKKESVKVSEIPGIWIEVLLSQEKKCIRCWQRSASVGLNEEHLEICDRCIVNIQGPGEERMFA